MNTKTRDKYKHLSDEQLETLIKSLDNVADALRNESSEITSESEPVTQTLNG